MGFCYLTAMGFAATVFGKGFRVYSIATMLLLVLGAVMAGLDIASVGANQPTPWMGAWERLAPVPRCSDWRCSPSPCSAADHGT